MRKLILLASALVAFVALSPALAVREPRLYAQPGGNVTINPIAYQDLRWRSIGPHRGGRSTAAAGVRTQPNVFYMGATGGGVWKTENYGITWVPVTDGQIATGSIGAIDVVGLEPERRLRRHRQRGDPIERDSRPRRLQVDRRGPHVAVRRTEGRRADRPAQGPSEESRHRLRRGDRQSVRLGTGARRLPHQGRRQDVAEGALHQRSDRRRVGGDQLVESRTRFTPARGAAQRKPWTIISGGPAAEGGVYKTTDGGDHWSRVGNGLPDDLIGKVWVDVAQSNPKVVYAQVEAKGAKGGLYRTSDGGVIVDAGQQLPAAARAAVLFQQGVRQPEGRERGLRHRARRSTGPPTAARRSPTSTRRTATTTSSGSIRTTPKIMIETNDGGANITQDGGKSWSTQMNQPTAELYMVDADEQFPYRLYAPQQDNSKYLRAPTCRRRRGRPDDPTQTWLPGVRVRERADSADAGRQDRSTATARASSGA